MTTAGMTAADPIAHETLRKGDLAQLADLIESHRVRTLDLGATGRSLWVANGNLVVQGVEPIATITADGVTTTDVNGIYAFSDVGVESLAARLKVSSSDLRKMRHDHPDLFDTVVGYHLRGELNGEPSPYTAPDNRKHTLRLLRADDAQDNEVDGMVRAILGSNYFAIDNVDLLTAVMEGMAAAGVQPGTFQVEADLTESRMVVKVWVPELYALAPAVFRSYRSPFSGEGVEELPRVFAGLVFSNSEVGRGAWSLTPRIVFQACKNGTNITKDAFNKRHVGDRLEDDGVIQWSQKTQKINLALITSKTADAVAAYLNVDYVAAKLAELAEDAGTKVKDAEDTILKVTRHTGHAAARSSILNMFIQGRDHTAGGVMQAYTAAANHTASADLAYELENRAADALAFAARTNR